MLRQHASPEKVQEYKESRGDQAMRDSRQPVLECNWDTVRTFVLLSSDWERKGLSGVFTGIPSPAIESVLSLSGITLPPEGFEDLKLMEATAKPVLNSALQEK